MVWIEGRPNPKLRRSYMDGTNVETIFSSSSHPIATPMDLAIDDAGMAVMQSDKHTVLDIDWKNYYCREVFPLGYAYVYF